jgi:cytochrome c
MRRFVPFLSLAAALIAGAAQADIERVRHLASECVSCHIPAGEPQGIPTIVGLTTEVFVAAFNQYRTGDRRHALMNTIASRYDDEEVKALAAYFSELGDADSP